MRIAGWLMLADEAGQGGGRMRLATGSVQVEEGQIVEVVEGDAAGRCDLGGPGFVVMPGLIDAHVHLSQFGIIGAYGLGLLDWLDQVTYPAELAWADPAVARGQAQAAMDRMLSSGTTGFAAYATVHRDGAWAALEVAEAMGVRAHIGQVLMDRGGPAGLCRPAKQLIEETAGLLERFVPGARVSAAVTPRFGPACSAGLLAQAGALAKEHGALIQTHLAETRAECALARELFEADSYTQVYRDAGLLTQRSVFGHGIYIDEGELGLLAEAGSTIAHCPTANSFLMSGRFDRAGALEAGVGLALGSDIGAGYEVSMVRVARAMVQTAASLAMDRPADDRDSHVVSAANAWHSVTAGNADALGWADSGRLLAGCPADLVVVEAESSILARPDALSALLFGWDDRWVRATVLNGRVAWRSGA